MVRNVQFLAKLLEQILHTLISGILSEDLLLISTFDIV